MPNIRDLVQALGGRECVDGVILLGHDGLTIDSCISGNLEIDSISALVPSVVDGWGRVGAESGYGQLLTCVAEYNGGLAIIAQLRGPGDDLSRLDFLHILGRKVH